jgi:Sterol-sensing domain of SREBP cleavage-activation
MQHSAAVLYSTVFLPLTALLVLQHSLPFTLLAISVDNYYEIISKMGEVGVPGQTLTIPQQMRRTMQSSGVAISMCTIANAVGAIVGSTSPYLAISQYCYYAVSAWQLLFIN